MSHKFISWTLWPDKEKPKGLDFSVCGSDRRGLLASMALNLSKAGDTLTIKALTFSSILPRRRYQMEVEVIGPDPTQLICAAGLMTPTMLFRNDPEQMKWLNDAPRLDVSTWSPARHWTVHFHIETKDKPLIILNAARRVLERGGWFYMVHAETRPKAIFSLHAYVIAASALSAIDLERDIKALRGGAFAYQSVEAEVLEPLNKGVA